MGFSPREFDSAVMLTSRTRSFYSLSLSLLLSLSHTHAHTLTHFSLYYNPSSHSICLKLVQFNVLKLLFHIKI